MDEFRALCAELVDELSDFQLAVIEAGVGWACPDTEALIDRARAALAEPEPKVAEPTYSEVLAIRDELDANGYGTVDLVAFARAVLARYGHQPAPPAAGKVRKLVAALRCEAVAAEGDPLWMSPSELRRAADLLEQRHPVPVPVAEGEVAELVVRLRRASDGASAMGWEEDSWVIARAADLLEQRHLAPVPVCERDLDSILSPSGGYELREGAALAEGAQLIGGEWWAPVFGCDSVESALNRIRQRLDPFQQNGKLKSYQAIAPLPVPASERLPGPEDCDADGKCWWYRYTPTQEWHLRFGRTGQHNHWLPANAMPLPQGEVQS